MDHAKAPTQPQNGSRLKLRLVFLPYIALAVGLLLVYTGLRWLLDIKLEIVPLGVEWLQIWIPGLLGLGIVFLVMRRRFALLNLRGERADGYFYYPILVGLLAAVPVMVTQLYVEQASFSLVALGKPSEIDLQQPQKYYRFDQFAVDSMISGGAAMEVTRNDGSNDFTLHLYIALPIVDSAANDPNGRFNVWFCQEYLQRMNDNLSDAEKDTIAEEFFETSVASFLNFDLTTVSFFENEPQSADREAYETAIVKQGQVDAGSPIVLLLAHSEAFENRTGNTLFWCFGSFAICSLIALMMFLIPKLDPEELQRFRERKPMSEDEFVDFLRFFIPRAPHWMTVILIDINIVLFLVMALSGMNVFSPDALTLLKWGASHGQLVVEGDYWRLLVNTFEHAGILHLAMNMFGLAITGMLTEPILGKWRLLIVYLVSGIAGSLASVFWNANVVSVGASGAIFGLFGAIFALLITGFIPKAEKAIYKYLLIVYGLVSLLFGFLNPTTDNAAHIGGLVAGFLCCLVLAFLFRKQLKPKPD